MSFYGNSLMVENKGFVGNCEMSVEVHKHEWIY